MRISSALLISLLALAAGTSVAHAAITIGIDDENDPSQGDTLNIPDLVHEIGLPLSLGGTFPTDEALNSSFLSGGFAVVVTILNLSGTDWGHVWYIADAGTNLGNYDGVVQPVAVPAFKIDAVGANAPLISESLSANGIWEAGEAWEFLIQGYSNDSGLAASEFNSIGIDSGSGGSSGSIVAIVPEPTSTFLLLLGLGPLLVSRRSRHSWPATHPSSTYRHLR